MKKKKKNQNLHLVKIFFRNKGKDSLLSPRKEKVKTSIAPTLKNKKTLNNLQNYTFYFEPTRDFVSQGNEMNLKRGRSLKEETGCEHLPKTATEHYIN